MDFLPYLLGSVLLFMLFMQLRLLYGAKRNQGQRAPDFSDLVDVGQLAQRRLLFYFYSENCGPCRTLTPVVERISLRRDNLVKVDVRLFPEAAQRFGVVVTPTFVLVADGRIERVFLGSRSEKKLEALLGSAPPPKADKLPGGVV